MEYPSAIMEICRVAAVICVERPLAGWCYAYIKGNKQILKKNLKKSMHTPIFYYSREIPAVNMQYSAHISRLISTTQGRTNMIFGDYT
jgi:hypothetical protein